MLSSERLNGIRAFVEAGQADSFAKAGERLGLSASAVGKTIARIEARLGVRLFHRTTRKLSLTDEGRSYYESCVRALAELESAEAALLDGRQHPSGWLRVNLPDLFGRKCAAPMLLQLARRYPQLRLEVSFENRFADLAAEGIDLAVRIGQLPDSSGLVARRIGWQDLILCAAPDYLDRTSQPSRLADLAAHACVTQVRGGGEEPWLFLDGAGLPRRLPVRGHHRFAALDVLAEAACAAMGIAQMPLWLARDHLANGRLVPVLPDLRQPRLPIHALWLQSPTIAQRVRVAIDALVQGLAETDEALA